MMLDLRLLCDPTVLQVQHPDCVFWVVAVVAVVVLLSAGGGLLSTEPQDASCI
jgi:hypothetical protein